MPTIAGKYQHYKNEDIEDYFAAVGVPYVARKMMGMSSPLMEITINGDCYTIKNTSMMRTIETSFKLGEEYDEKMPNATIKSISKLVDDELTTDSVIPESGEKCSRTYKFSDEGCVATLTHEKAAKVGKRYYKRVD